MPCDSSRRSLADLVRGLGKIVNRMQCLQSGSVTIFCRRCPSPGSDPLYQVALSGLPRPAYQFTRSQLNHYLSWRSTHAADAEAIQPSHVVQHVTAAQYVTNSMFDVLQAGGYGSVTAKFDRERKGKTSLIVELTISQRYSL